MRIDKNKLIESLTYEPLSFFEISRRNNFSKGDNRNLNAALFELMKENLIDRNRNQEYYRFDFVKRNFQGPIFCHKNGFGFIEFAKDKSAFVPSFRIKNIMNDDIVDAHIVKDPRHKGKFLGLINKVVTRKTEFLIGTLYQENNFFFLKPMDRRITIPVRVFNANFAFLNHRIKTKITLYDSKFLNVKFLRSMGPEEDPRSIIDALVDNSSVITEFSQKCLNEAREIPQEVQEVPENVKDLTDMLTVTIDGESTKDFDDAISVVKNSEDTYKLFVHIADVAHYVKEKSLLDEEALARGNSVYLIDRTIPMLPKELSNGICSLNPQVKRLTLTAEILIDSKGKNLDFQVYRSIIKSDHRLTYNEVNDFLSQKKTFDDNLAKMLLNASELSQILGDFKKRNGYVDLEIQESKVIIDENTKPIDIKIIERQNSEIMIENFMVRANESVAQFMKKKLLPCIYRVHERPSYEKFEIMKNVLKVLDINVNFHFTKSPKIFAGYIERLKEIRFDNFIKSMLLRTMEKAVYSEKSIGHFGLASKSYSHFTSPIRRYADLELHRILHAFIFDKKDKDEELKKHFQSVLSAICKHVSESERTQMNLERKVIDVKKAEFMSDKIGEKWLGKISGITQYGMFIEFANQINGLLRFEFLNLQEKPEISKNFTTAKIANKLWKLGSEINIKIVAVDAELGQINLAFA